MHLARALRLNSPPRLALVGAGGKTSALFCLARELLSDPIHPYSTVLLSATTHLAVAQSALADHHFIVANPDDSFALGRDLPEGVVLVTGPQVEDQRISGLDEFTLQPLLRLAQARVLPLLIEADGSRRRPLKAPALHEPVIPSWVDKVVVVAGLSGLGEPLDPGWVHRPERFSELAGLPVGAPITVDALARLLAHPQGGLKGIPIGARRVLLLNQADTPDRQAQARRLAEQLLGPFHAVLAAALQPHSLPDAGAVVYDKEGESVSLLKEGIPSLASLRKSEDDRPVLAVYEPVAGVILAAGGSSRLGQSKQLLPWRGQPLVRHVAAAAISAGLSPVVVVTGDQASQVASALEGMPLTVIHNSGWQAGQSTSLVAGLRALPDETGAVVFLLADQPQVPASLIRSLVELHFATLSSLAAPQVDGRRANPVLFDRDTFPDLLTLTGDVGGRALFSRYPVTWLPWHDPTLILDVDTLEDYDRLLSIE